MKFKKDEEGKLVLDEDGDPIAVSEKGEVIPLDNVVSLGKHQRVETERDTLKEQVEKMTADLEAIKANAGDTDALKKQIDELTEQAANAKTEFETKLTATERDHAIETALLGAGCVDTKAARAHIDFDAVKLADGKLSGLDLESFKTDRPYLFGSETLLKSAASTSGTPSEPDVDPSLEKAFGLPQTKE